MFENLLGQNASAQLVKDINAGVLAPAMLFSGPAASGKGTAALELARVLSCSEGAPWGCNCPACLRHRLLVHPDLLCLGRKAFSAEIAASAASFLRETGNASSRLLFIRSLRKLLARFNPVLWEDEPKGKILSPMVNSLEENLDELDPLANAVANNANDDNKKPLSKLIDGMIKTAFKLESEGISEAIHIAQLRRAAYWSRLAPYGSLKLLIIENSDRMQEEARNSLLKLLEEPPAHSRYVLCSERPGSLPSTVLSRLRPYRFISRDAHVEAEVIRRVFKGSSEDGGIVTYLDSFLPVSAGTLQTLAAYFAASAAYKAARLSKKQGSNISEEVILLGKLCARRAEENGMGRPSADAAAVISLILEKAEKFEARSLFRGFLVSLLDQVSESRLNSTATCAPAYNEIWQDCTGWAFNATSVYNLKPAQILEKLFADLSLRLAKL